MKTYDEASEEERRIFYNIAKLSIARDFNNGLPAYEFISRKSSEVERLVGMNKVELQESLNRSHDESMKLAFQSDSIKRVGFKKD